MPVVPWKTRKKNSELIAKLYQQNQRLKERLQSSRRETLEEVRDLIDDDTGLSLNDLREMLTERIQDT